MDRGYTPKKIFSLFDLCCASADRLLEWLFTTEFGSQISRGGWGNAAAAAYKKVSSLTILIIPNVRWL